MARRRQVAHPKGCLWNRKVSRVCTRCGSVAVILPAGPVHLVKDFPFAVTCDMANYIMTQAQCLVCYVSSLREEV